MNKRQPGKQPKSISEYGLDHAIRTDRDLAKFALIAFIGGVVVGLLA
jgi:hypothetical protein